MDAVDPSRDFVKEVKRVIVKVTCILVLHDVFSVSYFPLVYRIAFRFLPFDSPFLWPQPNNLELVTLNAPIIEV